MPNLNREYTLTGFKRTYHTDLVEIYKIMNQHIKNKNYKINDKEKLFKSILEYTYKHSDIKILHV